MGPGGPCVETPAALRGPSAACVVVDNLRYLEPAAPVSDGLVSGLVHHGVSDVAELGLRIPRGGEKVVGVAPGMLAPEGAAEDLLADEAARIGDNLVLAFAYVAASKYPLPALAGAGTDACTIDGK